MRRTKLIATLGPATDAPGVLDALVAAGMDVARLNTSHSTREELERRIAHVREAAARAARHVAVMLDLAGAKVRVGEMAPGTVLQAGEGFELRSQPCTGDGRGACVSYEGLARDLAAGDRVLLDDGRIALRVAGTGTGVVSTVVEVGGPLASHKGVNVPRIRLGIDSITPRDAGDLAWGLSAGVDLVAQSFVRSADDVARLRTLMGQSPVPIVAKIEKHEAVADLARIVDTADAVMVARGDLGVELPLEDVPVVQRQVVAACRSAGRPVIIATQMLESMTEQQTPTRAEASDVANAIFDAVDCVMLSGETAIGKDPARVLQTMGRIVSAAEAVAGDHPWSARPVGATDIAGAVSRAVCDLALDLELAAIVTATQSGATARAVAAQRPAVPIVAITPDERVARQLAVVWDVRPAVVPSYATIDEMIAVAAETVVAEGLARRGDLIAVTGGVAVHIAGSTNLIQVHRV